MTRAVLVAVLAFFATLLGAPAAYAEDIPDDLREWLGAEGTVHALNSPGAPIVDDDAEVTIGDSNQVWTWSEEFLNGLPGAETVVELAAWASPILVDGETAGGIVVGTESDTVVKWTVEFGRAAGAVTYRLVHDLSKDAWFTLNSGVVRPVSDEAREVLAGPLAVDLLQDHIREWNGNVEIVETEPPVVEPESNNIVFVTALAVVGVLGLVVVMVALRKEEAR